jgi:hypothetical protein
MKRTNCLEAYIRKYCPRLLRKVREEMNVNQQREEMIANQDREDTGVVLIRQDEIGGRITGIRNATLGITRPE